MKKLLLVLLAAFLLGGCGKDGEPSETTEPTEASVYTGTYEKDSAVEQETGGAIRQFRPGGKGYTQVTAMGSQLLLLAEGETTVLELLTGPECAVTGSAVLDADLSATLYQATDTGFLYYDKTSRQVICLDSSLYEIQRIPLPESMTGEPVFSDNGTEVFYCVGQEIRAIEIQQGVDRLIRSHSCEAQTLLGSWFDGSLLLTHLRYVDETEGYAFVATEDGSVVSEDPGILLLETAAERYYTHRMDGVTEQFICGVRNRDALAFDIPGKTVEALSLGLLLGVTRQEQKTVLDCYSADTGRKTASVTLSGLAPLQDIWADSRNQCLWLLMGDGTLLSWNPEASAVTDDTAFAGPVHTAQNPDTAGIGAQQLRAEELSQKYGVSVRIWQDAVQTPGSHTLEPEYQPTAIAGVLDTLDTVLGEYPADFLKKSVDSGLRICIVRSMDGKSGAVQYWDGNDAYIVLCTGNDIAYEFTQAFAYVVDVHILGNSPLADQWGKLNPEGFVYGQTQEIPGAFADPVGLQSVTDDRAHVFLQAMRPDNGELFASEILQNKLLTLCKAIRDAWGWEKKSETYPWEQYLTQSIAYQK